MYASFFDELEKIAASKFDDGRARTTTGVLLGASLLAGGALSARSWHKKLKSKRVRTALKQAYDSAFESYGKAGGSGGFASPGASKGVWDKLVSTGDALRGKTNPDWARTKDVHQRNFQRAKLLRKKHEGYKKAFSEYQKAGGGGGPVQGKKASKEAYDNFVRAGESRFGKKSKIFKLLRGDADTRYARWNAHHKK